MENNKTKLVLSSRYGKHGNVSGLMYDELYKAYDEAYKRLMPYLGIESKLRLSLNTVIKALEEGIYCIYHKVLCKDITYHKQVLLIKVHGYWAFEVMDDKGKYFLRLLKDYGKTWALTKEELE